MKKIFVVDWALLFSFLLAAITGVGMHIAGDGTSHTLWEAWAWIHSLTGLSFAAFAVWHVKMHKGWYKSLLKGKSDKKRHITVALSLIALIAAITGIAMFVVAGSNTGIGLWHYRIGIILSAVAAGHIIKRLPILRKSIS